jgi:hypothetical protein
MSQNERPLSEGDEVHCPHCRGWHRTFRSNSQDLHPYDGVFKALQPKARAANVATLKAELRVLDGKIANPTQAVAEGGAIGRSCRPFVIRSDATRRSAPNSLN